MQTLSAVKSHFRQSLIDIYPSEEADSLFYIVAQHIWGLNRQQVNLRLHEPLGNKNIDPLNLILDELRSGRPIQHIMGTAPFYGMDLYVTKHTLIPRPETEELVHMIIHNHKAQASPLILDIGTGSGCIALALAKNLPSSTVTAIDISDAALAVARQNAEKIGVAVDFLQGDITQWENLFDPGLRFDIIVSNPPYIKEDEKRDMAAHVLEHEPHDALFVENNNPLVFYNKITDFAARHLSASGNLYLEINQYLPTETAQLVRHKGFDQVAIHKDINGASRMISACRRQNP